MPSFLSIKADVQLLETEKKQKSASVVAALPSVPTVSPLNQTVTTTTTQTVTARAVIFPPAMSASAQPGATTVEDEEVICPPAVALVPTAQKEATANNDQIGVHYLFPRFQASVSHAAERSQVV